MHPDQMSSTQSIRLVPPTRTISIRYTLPTYFLFFLLYFPFLITNVILCSGTMPSKGASSSKLVAKKGNQKVQSSCSESIELSSSSGDLYQYRTKGKVDPKVRKVPKGKKLATPEDSCSQRQRRNNSSTFPPHSPLPSKA